MRVLKVGVAGFGAIGQAVAQVLDKGMPGLELAAVSSGNIDKAKTTLTTMSIDVPLIGPSSMASAVDIVVECAPTAVFASIAQPAVEAGCTLITVSGAAILENPSIITLAQRRQGKIILATGALVGLDAVRAASEGTIHSVRLVTKKPPASLCNAKFIVENNIALDTLSSPLQVFQGTAREGAQKFPSNVNVAAALALAGIGPDKTQLEIWADPALTRNTHCIEVDSDSARIELKIENVPTQENPSTGKITALSVIAALRSLGTSLRVGS